MDHCKEGGITVAWLAQNYDEGGDTDDLSSFVRVSSPFYPQLGLHYLIETTEWLDAREAEREEEEVDE